MKPAQVNEMEVCSCAGSTTAEQIAGRMTEQGVSELLVLDGYVLDRIITASHIESYLQLSAQLKGESRPVNAMTSQMPHCRRVRTGDDLISGINNSPAGLLLALDKDRNVLAVIRKGAEKVEPDDAPAMTCCSTTSGGSL